MRPDGLPRGSPTISLGRSRGGTLGRFRMPPTGRIPETPFRVRLSPDERAFVQEAAKANHQSMSQFMRDALVTAASECLESRPTRVIVFRLQRDL
jgi:hypothetical protein